MPRGVTIRMCWFRSSKILYLASPYSHESPEVREHRYRIACSKTAALIHAGHVVYSPIVHSHVLHRDHGLDGDWEFWREQDEHMIGLCEKVLVLRILGWEESKGVAAEIEIAKRLGKPVEYVG